MVLMLMISQTRWMSTGKTLCFHTERGTASTALSTRRFRCKLCKRSTCYISRSHATPTYIFTEARCRGLRWTFETKLS